MSARVTRAVVKGYPAPGYEVRASSRSRFDWPDEVVIRRLDGGSILARDLRKVSLNTLMVAVLRARRRS